MVGMIDEEDSIQMVGLVFEYLCEEPASTALESRTIEISGAKSDAFMPLCGAIDSADRKASFIDSGTSP